VENSFTTLFTSTKIEKKGVVNEFVGSTVDVVLVTDEEISFLVFDNLQIVTDQKEVIRKIAIKRLDDIHLNPIEKGRISVSNFSRRSAANSGYRFLGNSMIEFGRRIRERIDL